MLEHVVAQSRHNSRVESLRVAVSLCMVLGGDSDVHLERPADSHEEPKHELWAIVSRQFCHNTEAGQPVLYKTQATAVLFVHCVGTAFINLVYLSLKAVTDWLACLVLKRGPGMFIPTHLKVLSAR